MPLISSFFRLPGFPRRRARRRRMALLVTVVAVLCMLTLTPYFIYKPPSFIISYFQKRFPDVLFNVPTSKKIVALTIDDAPSEYTEQILEILKANDAPATFFVIGGQVPGRAGTLHDIVSAGNELGNHAMHDEPSISLSSDGLALQISQVDDLISTAYESAGKQRQSHLFRPGSGIFSTRILDVISQSGYKTILGSIYPHDPFIPYWRVNAWHILSMLRPGTVIICHDRRSWTVPMLRKVVPEMRRRGYEIVTVSRLLEEGKS